MSLEILDSAFHYDCEVGEEQFLVRCPHCGDEHSHHDCVDHFERAEDRIPACTRIGRPTRPYLADEDGNETGQPELPPDAAPDQTPSSRRNGLRIWLYCESCGGRFSIQLAQHKGNTFLALTKGIKRPHITIMDSPGHLLVDNALAATRDEPDRPTRAREARRRVLEGARAMAGRAGHVLATETQDGAQCDCHTAALGLPGNWPTICLWALAEVAKRTEDRAPASE